MTVTGARPDQPLLAGWRWVRLGEVLLETRNGLYKPENFYGSGTRILKMFNIGRLDGSWNLNQVDLIELSAEECSAYRLEEGDILFNRVNSNELVGKCAVVNSKIAGAVYESKNMRLRLDPNQAYSDFVCTFLNSSGGREQIGKRLKQIVGQATVNRSDLNSLEIPLPPLCEQQRIVTVLHGLMTAVEEARAAAHARLEATMALPAAIVRETLRTGSLYRHLLGDCLAEVRNGVGADWSKYPVLGATRDGLAPAKEGIGKSPERYKLVDPVTAFYNPMRILLGSIAIVDEGDATGITSPDYVVVKGRPGILDTRWFYYWFRSAYGAHLIDSLSRGAVRERILFNRLAAGRIQLPDYETQLRASERMKQVKPVAESTTKELAAINILPSALLREVFAVGA